MKLFTLLKENNIEVDSLRKKLKNLGFDIAVFDGITEEQFPLLVKLFKTTTTAYQKNISKNDKTNLQGKFKKIFEEQPFETIPSAPEKIREKQRTSHPDKILGIVKSFFNKVTYSGIINSLSDGTESRITSKNLQTTLITENDIVLYKQKPDGLNEYQALEVTNKIPVFIFNQTGISHSLAYPLANGLPEKEIALSGLFPSGFFVVTANDNQSGWDVILTSKDIHAEGCTSYGEKILEYFLQDHPEYTKPIIWLIDFLKPTLDKKPELKKKCNPIYLQKFDNDKEKKLFLDTLPVEEIIRLCLSVPDLAKLRQQYANKMLENECKAKDLLCFDLESDGEIIQQYAWYRQGEAKSNADFTGHQEGLTKLTGLIVSATGVIGHNIRKFDLPILEQQTSTASSGFIWDTLEIEMALNPERFSYGLKTKLEALEDTKLTYSLFKNQIARIISSEANWEEILKSLPKQASEFLKQIRHNPYRHLLDNAYLNKKSDDFFRCNPDRKNLPEQIIKEIKSKLDEEGQKIIIAPEFLWDSLSHYFNLVFYPDTHSLSSCLNKEKVEAKLTDKSLLRTALIRFIDSCASEGKPPYFRHLPIAIQLTIQQELSNKAIEAICDNPQSGFPFDTDKIWCIKPGSIESLAKEIPQLCTQFKAIVVGNEVEQLTGKSQLGQTFDFTFLFERLKNESVWLQMSGGKSFISLEQSHCRLLGVEKFPRFIRNIWMEKTGKGKFKLWCNQDNEAVISHLFGNKICYIKWPEESSVKTKPYLVRLDSKQSGYIAEQKRVNPESFYRRSYWLYQFKLLDGIGREDTPKILILNDESEAENLSAYARHMGYFIPDTHASIIRQLELLHLNKAPKKLLITSFRVLDKVISSNYIGPLDYIWDSFSLQEKMQMLSKQEWAEAISGEDKNEDDFLTDIHSPQKGYDLFSLIKRHRYMIDYYHTMLSKNNPASRLFLCDSRLMDYFGIERALGLNPVNVKMWNNEKVYEADKEIVTKFIPSTHENPEPSFDTEEAKEILRHIFLTPEKGAIPFEWYPYQHPCLDAILPAKKDLLISLPTGAGKSLLFQAPALFRSAFSNKLSIVITPLRALMQDQVEALWKRGFYSNVEYLSGDKSQAETRDIYRRVAGGEITLLFITPERFRSRSFENAFLARLAEDNGLEYVVFDEAHCISQWGQDFRPDYLNAGKKVAEYSRSYPMSKLLFSATISEQVFEEISILMPGITPVEGTEKIYNPVRDHIRMTFRQDVEMDKRLHEIATYLKSGGFNPSLSRAIIFVKSRKRVDECAMVMTNTIKDVFGENCDFADKIGGFHAGMDAEDRKDMYEKYRTGEIVILFATKAFGMGMDIPDIHFIVHYSPPGTFEDFLQEVGRAGRNKEMRLRAGFSQDKPIETLCLTEKNDFKRLKDQLHKSRISWQEIKDILKILKDYITGIKPLKVDSQFPVAVPFNLYSLKKSSVDGEFDTKFRIALYWLERLERIKLGYFTLTHIDFEYGSLIELEKQNKKDPEGDCKKACEAILQLMPRHSGPTLQLSIASLRSFSQLSFENLMAALLKCHAKGILQLKQNVIIQPTNFRSEEINYCREISDRDKKYPALRVLFSLVYKILNTVPLTDSKLLEEEDLNQFLQESITEMIDYEKLPWEKKGDEKSQLKKHENYINDICRKRSKHAFTIIRLLSKARYESSMEKVPDSNQQIQIKQSVFNGYHKKKEWIDEINLLEDNCIDLLDYVSEPYFEQSTKEFNWPDLISKLNLKDNVQHLSNLFFILSVLGYSRVNGLLPAGIEVYLTSLEPIDEQQDDSKDKTIYHEFSEAQQIRELKQISLQLLSTLNPGEHDAFIKGFFAAKSKLELINHLQDKGKVDDNHPVFKAFRGEAMKYQEEHNLNEEQKIIYHTDIDQHIQIMAGPGSGKTHTLTLRVAKLVYRDSISPEEILVLAYNRAVVSELKERLGKLFRELGFGNLSNRIKIYTFHGLAKKYIPEKLTDLPFDEWEPELLRTLQNSPGCILNRLSPLKHILVDEFQDINEVRMDILHKLTDVTQAFLFTIGDPNQSIYGYERKHIDPYHYYEEFVKRFTPREFRLTHNHRSYPDILALAKKILPAKHQKLVLKAIQKPDASYKKEYVQIYDYNHDPVKWWEKLAGLLSEKIRQDPQQELKSYRQIAIFFRTNNEVYRGFQKLQSMQLSNIRIRIQGNLPYEFTRIRECHAIIQSLKQEKDQLLPPGFRTKFKSYIKNLLNENPRWNHFYLYVMHALVLEYLDELDEIQTYDKLLEFIEEMSYKDDGQLYKLYEKYLDELDVTTRETEIVLTTMHKVKGLEFDCVVIPPSFANLPLSGNNQSFAATGLREQLDEEKRLAYVAYTRAKYRLLIFNHARESALANNQEYTIPPEKNSELGILMQAGIDKLNIGWAAKSENFNRGIHNHIKETIKSGDPLVIKRKETYNNGNNFTVYELYKENESHPIGELARKNDYILKNYQEISGFVVNEIVIWTYEDTCKSDTKNKTDYATQWCPEAIEQGYIYLIDFAGFGKGS